MRGRGPLSPSSFVSPTSVFSSSTSTRLIAQNSIKSTPECIICMGKIQKCPMHPHTQAIPSWPLIARSLSPTELLCRTKVLYIVASATVVSINSRLRVEKPRTRNSSEDEIANVNFFYDDIVHVLQNTIDSCINSATDRRSYVLERMCLPNAVK